MKPLFLTSFVFLLVACGNPKIKVDPSNLTDIQTTDSLVTNTIKIGVAAMLTPEETLPVYQDVIDYIGKKMEIEVEMIFTKDYTSMNNLVKDKKVIAAFVCSGAYVIGREEWNMELIATPVHNGETNYYSNIIVHKKSNYNEFLDLEGKRFAFTDPKSNTGKLVPTYELARNNMNPEDFFSEIIYSGSHDNSIEAVAKNLVDGAAVDNLIWDYLKSRNSVSVNKTKVIDQFGPFCTPPVVTYPELDIAMKNKIRNTLIQMHEDNQGKKILEKLLIDKFIVVHDSCYNSIRNMQRWVKNN